VIYTQGKVGDDLLNVSQRQDQTLEKKGLPGDFLTRHGDFAGPRDTHYATVNQLTYTNKQLSEPRVDTFLWNGRNHHDAKYVWVWVWIWVWVSGGQMSLEE
jgi:hypothetical protein